MNKKIIIVVISVVLIIIALIIILSSTMNNVGPNSKAMDNPTPVSEPVSMPNEVMIDESENKPGEYIPYSFSNLTNKTNVIFFAAGWCPTCQALNKAIEGDLNSIPNDLTILKADYDKETDLKIKYGVTYQHTLVQVDKEGNMIKKWSGSYTVQEIINQLV